MADAPDNLNDKPLPDGPPSTEKPAEELVAELPQETKDSVQEFLAEAAQQNEAANEAVTDAAETSADAAETAAAAVVPYVQPDSEPPAAYIAFENVSKSFGDLDVLKDVSFFVPPGETLCILGRSGVGKSVSLQILMGFLRADSGRVLVAGEDICNFTEKQLQVLRRKVTMVFQNGALFDSISVGENVAFPLRERGDLEEDQIQRIVNGMLEMVGVAGME